MDSNQISLFNLISNYAVDSLVGALVCITDKYGIKALTGDAMNLLFIPFIEQFFNDTADKIISRENDEINQKFDQMINIPLASKYHASDCLIIIATLTLKIYNEMNLVDIITDNISLKEIFTRIKIYIVFLSNKYKPMAKTLTGCIYNNEHMCKGEKLISITSIASTNVNGKDIKLSTL